MKNNKIVVLLLLLCTCFFLACEVDPDQNQQTDDVFSLDQNEEESNDIIPERKSTAPSTYVDDNSGWQEEKKEPVYGHVLSVNSSAIGQIHGNIVQAYTNIEKAKQYCNELIPEKLFLNQYTPESISYNRFFTSLNLKESVKQYDTLRIISFWQDNVALQLFFDPNNDLTGGLVVADSASELWQTRSEDVLLQFLDSMSVYTRYLDDYVFPNTVAQQCDSLMQKAKELVFQETIDSLSQEETKKGGNENYRKKLIARQANRLKDMHHDLVLLYQYYTGFDKSKRFMTNESQIGYSTKVSDNMEQYNVNNHWNDKRIEYFRLITVVLDKEKYGVIFDKENANTLILVKFLSANSQDVYANETLDYFATDSSFHGLGLRETMLNKAEKIIKQAVEYMNMQQNPEYQRKVVNEFNIFGN